MNARSFSLSIIIPTKNRELTLGELLESLRGAANIGAIRPEVIVANNGSDDGADDFTANAAKDFPITLRVLSVVRPGNPRRLTMPSRRRTAMSSPFSTTM